MGWFTKKKKKKKASTMTPGQRANLDALTGVLQGQIGRGITPYSGELVAGPSALQKEAFTAADSFGTDDAAVGRSRALADIVAGKPAYEASPEEYERIYREGVEAPAMRQWQQTVIPQILQQYGAAGPSGAVVSGLGESGQTLATNLAAQRAQYRFQGEQDRQAALESAAQRRLAGIETSRAESLAPIALKASLGDVQRGIAQEQNEGEYARWEMAQPWANPWLGFLPNALGSQAFVPYQTGGGLQPWAQVMSSLF